MKKRGHRAQVAIEYLVLIGVVMLMIIPAVYVFSERQRSFQSKIIASQVNQIGTMIIDNVRTVRSLSQGTKVVLEVNFPVGINNVTIMAGRELVFNVRSSVGDSDLIYTCYFCQLGGTTLNGTFTINDFGSGTKIFKIESCKNFIGIQRVIKDEFGDFVNASSPGYICD